MTSTCAKRAALAAAGVPCEQHEALIAMAESMRDMKMEEKLSLNFLLFDVNPLEYIQTYEERIAEKDDIISELQNEIEKSSHREILSLPKELDEFTTISELEELSNMMK